MASLGEFRKLTEDYADVADFVIVYISEAHPTDGWAIEGNVFQVSNHKNMKEREEAARRMVTLEPVDCPVLLDRLDDAANKAYAALPERLYIVHGGSIVFKGDQGPLFYKVHKVEDWLKAYTEKRE
ncbi:type I iodothyronine deiodinase [Penaeus vannamei]|uniref:Iodothyronine deiodinase n=1 Tax=Penaeus vannamei TaxID=6689 RepID=A0A423U2M1_PENVA|nr:type I iodothyronine deiodinase [Penaeus vannamei]